MDMDWIQEDIPEQTTEFVLPAVRPGKKIETSLEALSVCINDLGRVNLDYMEKKSGISKAQLITDLRGKAIFQEAAVFLDHSYSLTEGWVLASVYFTGDLRRKLKEARAMEKRIKGAFDVNIQAIQDHLPEPVELRDIFFSLGAPWISDSVYTAFIQNLLGAWVSPDLTYNPITATWKLHLKSDQVSFVSNQFTYGTVDMPAVKIIENTLNARTIKVYDRVPHFDKKKRELTTKSVLNQEKSLAAQEKQREIMNQFEDFVFSDFKLVQELEEEYNDLYNTMIDTRFDGTYLSLPDLNPDITLYPHQRSAVARVLLSPSNTLLAHEVGTGKTYEMVVSAHELYRTGLSRKNLVVVPNQVLQDIVASHRLLYPNDKILVITPQAFKVAKRPELLRQVRNEEYVACYMAFSSFDLIKMSKTHWINRKREEIETLKQAMDNDSLSYGDRDLIERRMLNLSEKLMEYVDTGAKLDAPGYDELGIETLFVDEAHNYKNIPITSHCDGVVGMQLRGSAKAREMIEKCRITKRIVFATGTPLTNSIADLYTLMTLLQPKELESHRIQVFDQWISTFARREVSYEVDVDGSSLRAVTRFATFHNLHELMAMFSQVCDFHYAHTRSDLLPAFSGYTDIEVSKTIGQKLFIEKLTERKDRIRNREVHRKEDNLLSITTQGRLVALDPRLAGLELEEAEIPQTKVSQCADRAASLYHDQPGTAQLIFSDLGVPKEGFNIYDELKAQLIKRGIPSSEIAYIHDADTEAARETLFRQVNKGEVRIVIGSTGKLGTGVNVQERLIAAHHLSIPWRPSDMVQREGRILRQGNTCPEIFIYRYITKGTFDSFSWQVLENKQRFIASFLNGTATERSADDIADTVLTYAEVKALAMGNPLIKKRIEAANKLEKAEIASGQRKKQLEQLAQERDMLPDRIKEKEAWIVRTQADAELFDKNRYSISQEDRHTIGIKIVQGINQWRKEDWSYAKVEKDWKKRTLCEYRGFVVSAPIRSWEPKIEVRNTNNTQIWVLEINPHKPIGTTMSLDYLLSHFWQRVKEGEEELVRMRANLDRIHKELAKGNEFLELTQACKAKLKQIDEQIAISNQPVLNTEHQPSI